MSRDEAITAAAQSLALAYMSIFEGTPEEAADRALTPGGPTRDQLISRISEIRTTGHIEEAA